MNKTNGSNESNESNESDDTAAEAHGEDGHNDDGHGVGEESPRARLSKQARGNGNTGLIIH